MGSEIETASGVPPTVLQVIPRLDAGGAERTALEVAGALAAAGGRAVVAAAGGRLVEELRALGGEFVALPAATKNPYGMAANVLRLIHLAQAVDARVIHARSRAPAWSAFAAARALGLPFVTTYHGTYNARSGLKRFYNSVMARGDVVIANSRFIAERIAAGHHVPAGRIVTIPRGADMARFDPAAVGPQARHARRASWGAGDRELVLLLPARLTAWKGQELFIDALARLGPAPDWRAVLVGDAQGRDAYRAGLEARIAAAGLGRRVLLTGHETDMPAAYAAADIVVSPAVEPEAFGRVAVEAQAMARPVIVADHGGARETVHAGGASFTGWRVAPGDPAALAGVLDAALSLSADARAAIGARGRAHVIERFSVRAMTDATLAVYRRVCDR